MHGVFIGQDCRGGIRLNENLIEHNLVIQIANDSNSSACRVQVNALIGTLAKSIINYNSTSIFDY